MVYITDRFKISKRDFSPEGYLIVKDSRLARVGVLKYTRRELPNIQGIPPEVKPDQAIRVYRGPDELFKQEVLDSFKSQPMTFTHPNQLVTVKNSKRESVGFAKEDVRREGDFMVATLMVTDESAINKIKDGIEELSLGYTANIVWKPGTSPDGEVYDAVQENIAGNHIAIVPKGRCGTECKISDEQKQQQQQPKRGSEMPEIILDGISYECPEQTAQAFKKVLKRNEDLAKQVSTLTDGKNKAEKELQDEKEMSKKKEDEAKAKLDEAEESKVKDHELDALVAERSEILDTAKTIVKGFDSKGKSNQEIKTEVVKDACPDLVMDGLSEDYINARFDAIKDRKKEAPATSAIADAVTSSATGDVVNDAYAGMSKSQAARQKKIDENRKKNRGVS